MMHRKGQDERLRRIMDQLADSVFEASDEEILAEVRGFSANPDEEAGRTRTILREASRQLEIVNRRLSHLGHTINPNSWKRGWSGYRNICEVCGSFVSLKIDTGEMQGEALDEQCSDRDQFIIRRRAVSREYL
jgi:hypothetical protein